MGVWRGPGWRIDGGDGAVGVWMGVFVRVCGGGGGGGGGAPGENKPFNSVDSLPFSFWMRLYHI